MTWSYEREHDDEYYFSNSTVYIEAKQALGVLGARSKPWQVVPIVEQRSGFAYSGSSDRRLFPFAKT